MDISSRELSGAAAARPAGRLQGNALTGAALGWIREDLDKQLRKVRQQIENLSANALAGDDALHAAGEEVEQLRLTFDTLVLYGIAKVMTAIQGLFRHLLDDATANREAAVAILMETMVVVPAYLDRLQAGHQDLPILLLPLINRLRDAQGAEPLTESTLFSPLLEVELPELEFQRRPGYDEPFDYFTARMCRQFEMALLDWQQNPDQHALLSPLHGICETLRHRLERHEMKRLWWVATEVVGGLMDGQVENDLGLRNLLERLLLLLANIAELGEETPDTDSVNALTQALLFHVAKSPRSGSGLDLVRDRFELDRLLPDRDVLMRARGTLSGRDREMYNSLNRAVQDELSVIKDALDLELRTRQVDPEHRRQSLDALQRLSDTLHMLGMATPAQSIGSLMSGFAASAGASQSEREGQLMTLAEALLKVESSLNEQIETLGEPLPDNHPDAVNSFELRRIRSHLLDEAVASVYLSQDALRQRLSGDDNAEPAVALEQVAGALTMIEEPAVAELTNRLAAVLRIKLKRVYSEAGIRAKDLTAMTDAMAALELYLAARRDQQPDIERFINILDDRLETLQPAPAGGEVRTFPVPTLVRQAPTEAPYAPEAVAAKQPDTAAAMDEIAPPPPSELVTAPPSPPAPEAFEAQPEAQPEAVDPALAAAAILPAPIDPELRDIFLEEYEQVLENLQHAIPDWMREPGNVEALTSIRRAFHTLKGSGRMVGADELGDFSWQIEDMLNALLEGRVADATDMQVMVRLAQATLPALRQRLLQQPAGMGHAVIMRIGHQAQALGRGQRADWEALRSALPAYLAGMLPGAITPKLQAAESKPENVLAVELADNLRPIQELLESISRNRGNRTHVDQLRAMHTIAGALAMDSDGRDADVAKALEQLLEAQSRTGRHFTNESVWTLVSAVGQIQARLERLNGGGEPPNLEEQSELVVQLKVLAREFATLPTEEEAPPVAAFDPGTSVFAAGGGATLDDDEDWQSFASDLTGEIEDTGEPGDAVVEAGVDADIITIFLEEAGEVLGRADSLLNQWRDDVSELRFVRHLQREIHTLKGGARMSGLLGVGDYAHTVETLLEQIAGQQLAPSVSAIQLLEEACDRLHRWVEEVSEGRQPDATRALALLEQQVQGLHEVLPERTFEPEPVEADAAPSERELHDIPEAPAAAQERAEDSVGSGQVRVDAELLDRLVNAAGEVNIFRSRMEQQVGGLRANIGEFDETLSRMREQFRKLEIEIETRIRSNYTNTTGNGSSGFDPLEMDEFSMLHQLARGMSESVADLLNLQEMLEDNARKSEQLLLQQSRVATELQEGLMRTRMVPFGSIASRLRRTVRGAATETGKKARLQLRMVGSSDALDRNVLEHITAPLEHMMRNAVVHGIETPNQRKSAGKPAEGEISVVVEAEATEFVIRIADDGAGIDLDAIRKRAVERGLLAEDAQPHPEQLYEFILDSGFSTTDTVTSLAGRGVGMDVVSSEIKQIGGSLEIESESGRGTHFTIRIPFTLAVMQAIGVIAGKQRYLLPLTSVVGVSRMLPDEYTALVGQSNPQYRFAGREYPVLDLEQVLGEPARPLDRDNVSLLILSAGEQRAAFRVTELLPHREIVIKPVGPQISCVPGILGGSISASGEVMVILDPGPMIRHARLHGVSLAPVVQPATEVKQHPLAMVVDDSITMRKVTSRVLESHGLEVITARDGVDALEQMQERTPDILLLDIEMPRMDGYELAGHVRDDVRLRRIPIIMITSRAGQKHRERAKQVGANAYLSKPYAESELLDQVQRLLRDGID